MADRRTFVHKTPADILEDVVSGHQEALYRGTAEGKKYLLHFIEKFNSIPNAVKFFVYDLLVEDAYQSDDAELCAEAAQKATGYIEEAITEADQSFRKYKPSIRCFERGISVSVDSGAFEKAVHFCDQAIKLGMGKAYEAKKHSIEGML
jgi:hypothetical protein